MNQKTTFHSLMFVLAMQLAVASSAQAQLIPVEDPFKNTGNMSAEELVQGTTRAEDAAQLGEAVTRPPRPFRTNYRPSTWFEDVEPATTAHLTPDDHALVT